MVVAVEAVRPDRCILAPHMFGQAGFDRGRFTTLQAPTFECGADRRRIDGARTQSVLDRSLQFRCAVAIKQPQQRGRERTDVGATFGGPDHQGLTDRHGPGEAVEAAMLARLTLDLNEILQVSSVFDLLATIIAATVTGDHLRAVEDPDLAEIGPHAQHAPNMGMGNRVVVQVEPHIGRFADLHGDLLLNGIRVGGQRQKQWLLLCERLAYCHLAILRTWSVRRFGSAPLFGLGIQVVEIGELAGDEECLPDM